MLQNLMALLAAYLPVENEEGQGMAEYGLILALIAIVVIAALTLIGGNLTEKFNEIAGNLN
jgi:pilus assembly protein Flp/PilA